jgi:hypothetical protein
MLEKTSKSVIQELTILQICDCLSPGKSLWEVLGMDSVYVKGDDGDSVVLTMRRCEGESAGAIGADKLSHRPQSWRAIFSPCLFFMNSGPAEEASLFVPDSPVRHLRWFGR